MEIRDSQGKNITNPDLELGYLVLKTEKIIHPAIEGIPEKSEYRVIYQDPNNSNNKIVVKEILQREVLPKDSWTEEKQYQEYVQYTQEELQIQQEEKKKREEQIRLEQEEINKKQQILREQLAEMPSRMDHTESQVEDLAVVLVEIIEGA